jgi:hypothetical protein
MSSHSVFDGGKANSLVFTFAEALRSEEDFDAPEPDFLTWVEKGLFVDVATASDEAMDAALPTEEREAWKMFHDAIDGIGNLLDLYKSNLPLFQKVAPDLRCLPSFLSRHPDSQRFNRVLLENSHLSQRNIITAGQPLGPHLARQSWPVRYAYAVIATIDVTLDTDAERIPFWAELYGYGVKHPIDLSDYEAAARKMGWGLDKIQQELPKYQGCYRILPSWTRTLAKLRRPFNSVNDLDYWRTGKEIILEEMPDFHQRPEWEEYRTRRHYTHGAKTGAIQHAIFKDILAALRTIAGANKRHQPSAAP